ncbi:hypothetical protein LEP1GSC197_3655 [Leptospira interrogans serovar Pomona str. CSL4002]|nr:hypothetical protein LEP1GSC200_3414 [Leptospira interrogans serovar Pomona str. CSL10083]EMJ63986.1 hypothetical protein LEP1GSC197_3655 [Leptospira interrogans serovar Pomona str. CSL4002]
MFFLRTDKCEFVLNFETVGLLQIGILRINFETVGTLTN